MSEVVGIVILFQKGCYKRVRRYLRDKHPGRGVIVEGHTGWETVEEVDVLIPFKTFSVIDLTPSKVSIEEIK